VKVTNAGTTRLAVRITAVDSDADHRRGDERLISQVATITDVDPDRARDAAYRVLTAVAGQARVRRGQARVSVVALGGER